VVEDLVVRLAVDGLAVVDGVSQPEPRAGRELGEARADLEPVVYVQVGGERQERLV
jgi:hypothetical protein